MDIDNEVLISLVESKPALWDKTVDSYKDRLEKRRGWEEVCCALRPDFESANDLEKKSFGKEVIRRWTNLRDSYAKSKRDDKGSKKSGSEAKKRKKYVFSDQLKFLDKVYTANATVDSFDVGNESEPVNDPGEAGEPGGSDGGDPFVAQTNVIPFLKSKTTQRKPKKVDEVELKMLKALEPKLPCSKMAFLQSLMPHLNNYSEREFLQFQMGVLNVIENINKQQDLTSHSRPNYASSMPSHHPIPQYMSQPTPVTQRQSYLEVQQPSFRQYQSNTFPPHFSTNINQHHPLPSQKHPPTISTTAHQTTPPPTTQSTSQSLQGFCYSDSPIESLAFSPSGQNTQSPEMIPSEESNYSDIF